MILRDVCIALEVLDCWKAFHFAVSCVRMHSHIIPSNGVFDHPSRPDLTWESIVTQKRTPRGVRFLVCGCFTVPSDPIPAARACLAIGRAAFPIALRTGTVSDLRPDRRFPKNPVPYWTPGSAPPRWWCFAVATRLATEIRGVNAVRLIVVGVLWQGVG